MVFWPRCGNLGHCVFGWPVPASAEARRPHGGPDSVGVSEFTAVVFAGFANQTPPPPRPHPSRHKAPNTPIWPHNGARSFTPAGATWAQAGFPRRQSIYKQRRHRTKAPKTKCQKESPLRAGKRGVIFSGGLTSIIRTDLGPTRRAGHFKGLNFTCRQSYGANRFIESGRTGNTIRGSWLGARS